MNIAAPLQAAIDEFNKFPGVGKKSAQRLALHLLNSNNEDFEKFISVMHDLKTKIKFCSVCFNLTEFEVCSICSSTKRDNSTICVVEQAIDVMSIEKTNEYTGLYHVLGGVLSPLSGIGQDDLRVKELVQRLVGDDVKEIIMALNPDTEGETTSLFLAKLLKPFNVKVTRIARGIPIGGDLEFSDEATIGRAVTGRIIL